MAHTKQGRDRIGIRCLRLMHCLTAAAVVAGAALGTAPLALAQSLNQIDFAAPRGKIIAELAAVPSGQLRQAYLACARESNQRLLDPGEAMVCAMVADTLLASDFNGDFTALIAWWQSHRDASIAMARH